LPTHPLKLLQHQAIKVVRHIKIVGLLEHSLGAQPGQLGRSETKQQLQGDLFRLSQQKDRLEAEIKIVWAEVAQTLR
jgi:hypothetical protein